MLARRPRQARSCTRPRRAAGGCRTGASRLDSILPAHVSASSHFRLVCSMCGLEVEHPFGGRCPSCRGIVACEYDDGALAAAIRTPTGGAGLERWRGFLPVSGPPPTLGEGDMSLLDATPAALESEQAVAEERVPQRHGLPQGPRPCNRPAGPSTSPTPNSGGLPACMRPPSGGSRPVHSSPRCRPPACSPRRLSVEPGVLLSQDEIADREKVTARAA